MDEAFIIVIIIGIFATAISGIVILIKDIWRRR